MQSNLLVLLGLALVALLLVDRLRQRPSASGETGGDLLSLQGGETVAIRSLATNKYLALQPSSGRVVASATSADEPASQFRVLVLDTDTVAALMRSSSSIDEHRWHDRQPNTPLPQCSLRWPLVRCAVAQRKVHRPQDGDSVRLPVLRLQQCSWSGAVLSSMGGRDAGGVVL
jgi:hypothetical protein